MNVALIIDSIANSQENLIEQLKSLGVTKILVAHTKNEALEKLSLFQNEQLLTLIDVSDGLQGFPGFSNQFRKQYPKAILIAMAEEITLADLKMLIRYEIDHFLRLPFTADQFRDKVESAVQYRKQVLNEMITTTGNSDFAMTIEMLTDQSYRACLSGWLTNDEALKEVKPVVPDATLFVDCGDLRVINSIGIKRWLIWLKAMAALGFTRFEFEKMRPGFLQLASFVAGFIPPNGSINSFYLHYWNDELDLKKDFKFSMGVDYTEEKMLIPKVQKLDEDGKPTTYELDDAATLILRFYKGSIELK